MSNELQKTALAARHEALGGKMVDFAGWLMPVQYSGILDEHRAVRESVGVFDISHMGELFVSGLHAADWLESLLSNRIAKLEPGTGQYTFLLNENGGVIDDLIVYQTGSHDYLLVVNASKIAEDEAWLRKHLPDDGVELQNRSGEHIGLAIQGPESPLLFSELCGGDLPEKNRIVAVTVCGIRAFACITGYTGELGFELFAAVESVEEAERVFNAVLDAGAKPCGLGARDTLRLEMCYPLNGSDLSPEITPLQAGMGFFVDLEKRDYPGRDALRKQKEEGLPTKLCAILLEGKAPPLRPHYPVYLDGEQISETTSGALSPSLGAGIAMAYLPADKAKIGTALEIGIRDRRFPAGIVRKPFYKKSEE